jgi:hypothetical protein
MADSPLDAVVPPGLRQQTWSSGGPFPDYDYDSSASPWSGGLAWAPDGSQTDGATGDNDPLAAQMQKQRQANAACLNPLSSWGRSSYGRYYWYMGFLMRLFLPIESLARPSM